YFFIKGSSFFKVSTRRFRRHYHIIKLSHCLLKIKPVRRRKPVYRKRSWCGFSHFLRQDCIFKRWCKSKITNVVCHGHVKNKFLDKELAGNMSIMRCLFTGRVAGGNKPAYKIICSGQQREHRV